MSGPLDGMTVLVTRPQQQSDRLARLISERGGRAILFPTLQIEADLDPNAIQAAIGDISAFDIAVFISSNAVRHGVGFLPEEGQPSPALAAIGPSTARALAEAGFETDIRAEDGFTSEALLRTEPLQHVDGKRIVIFRGIGGRAMLGRELERRGAEVVYAEVYRRDRPDELTPEVEAALAAGEIDAVTATSAETLVNLYELTEQHAVAGLLQTQLVTASARVVKKAAALGFERPALLATGPDDDALVQALADWRRAKTTDTATDDRMTEQNDPAKPIDEQAPHIDPVPPPAEVQTEVVPQRARSGSALSLLAMLLSLAALAVSGWLWWQGEQGASAAGSQLDAVRAELAPINTGLSRLDSKLDGALDRISELSNARGRIESQLDDLDDSVSTLGARIQGAEKSIDDVRGVSAAARDNWVRAEAEYYMQAANSRLQLARDPDAALAALGAADDRLESLGDPSLFRVRQLLADEIEALRSVPRPDIEGIAHTLNGLAGRVDELPLTDSSPRPLDDNGQPPEIDGDNAWERFKSTMLGVVGDIVSVKRTDEQARPLLSRDEEFFLKRNLELQLQTARLALLRGDAANYRESLRTARQWVQEHFLTSDAAVQSATETLTRLEGETIAPVMPDISGSLRQLRRSAPASGDAA